MAQELQMLQLPPTSPQNGEEEALPQQYQNFINPENFYYSRLFTSSQYIFLLSKEEKKCSHYMTCVSLLWYI
jgi:hypothetical protein